ncbi:MAG: ribulokinase, partial [Lentisphaerae bacterium]|nr:ribulokinase [Lentisphaerota bacterium]
MDARFSIGIDYGTNSVRALAVDVATGAEVGTSVFNYPTGDHGIVIDPSNPDLARQQPRDYLQGLEAAVRGALKAAAAAPGFAPDRVIGL